MYVISDPVGEYYYPQCTDKKNRGSTNQVIHSSVLVPPIYCLSYGCVQAARLLFPSPASLTELPNPVHYLPQPPAISRPSPRPMSLSYLKYFSLLSHLYLHPLSRPRCRRSLFTSFQLGSQNVAFLLRVHVFSLKEMLSYLPCSAFP